MLIQSYFVSAVTWCWTMSNGDLLPENDYYDDDDEDDDDNNNDNNNDKDNND